MGATENPAIRLYTVTDDAALAMSACWRESVDGAFEAVEDMSCSSGSHLERLVVVIPAHLTDRHNSSHRRDMDRRSLLPA